MHRLLRVLAVLVATFLVAQPALALDKAGLIKALETKYKTMTTIKATVQQTTRSELLGVETVTGDLMVKRPAKLRWSQGDKLFVSDGKKMWIYTAEDKQVIEYDDIAANRASAEQMLTSLDRIEEKFAVTLVSSDATQHVVDLAPKTSDQGFKKVKLVLGADLMVKSVTITDAFDNVTEMVFKTVTLNATIDDSQFVFSVPTGVDVIKAN